MSDVSPDQLLAVAEEAATISADFLTEKYNAVFKHRSESLEIQTKSSERDLVTQVDGAAQKLIVEVIQKHFPEHRFIAEEEGAEELGSAESPYEWIIDPLDGTTNFVHGKENFGTIIAVRKNKEIQAGVMRMPIMDRHYSASLGGGAFVNGNPATLRRAKSLQDAVICSNFVWRAEEDDRGTLMVSTPRCGSLENYGCAVQELGDVLHGWNDGVFFKGIPLWDISAGFLMISEAGGVHRIDELGNNKTLCVASTVEVFDELCDFVFEKQLA